MVRKPPSQAQRRQRQISWLVRITSGMHANLANALQHSDCLTNVEYREVNVLRKDLETLEKLLRSRM